MREASVQETPTWSKQPGDISRALDAERAGQPFVLYRDQEDRQRILRLDPGVNVSIGRGETCDVAIVWDERVSRVHAELLHTAGEWAISDDGLSRNGTFVNGERISGRRRLHDHDVVRMGRTALLFRRPAADPENTAPADDLLVPDLTAAQRRVLVALCRPCLDAGGFSSPATNEDIAHALNLSVDAVKSQLRVLFTKFAVGELPQNQKRMRLVQLALDSGAVGPEHLPRR
jgi:FHA domain